MTKHLDLTEVVGQYYHVNKQKNMTWKSEIKSFIITFFTGFALVFVEGVDSISLEGVKDGALVGLLFAGFRAGIKAVIELFIRMFAKK